MNALNNLQQILPNTNELVFPWNEHYFSSIILYSLKQGGCSKGRRCCENLQKGLFHYAN